MSATMSDINAPETNAPETKAPHKGSILELREVTEHNWRQVCKLKMLEEQEGNLASNVYSLVEAHYSEDAWWRALYAEDTMVGFLMMAIWDPKDAYYIWRFMLDAKYQGMGFGKQGVQLAIDHVRQHNPKAKLLRCMATPPEGFEGQGGKKGVKPEHSPYNFYIKLGFKKIAEADEDGEIELALDLESLQGRVDGR